MGPDGNFATRVFGAPVNFRDAQGNWQPIDDSLVSSGAAVANRADAYRAAIPNDLAEGPVSVSDSAGSVGLRLEGVSGKGAVSGSSDVFAGAMRGVSVSYTAAPQVLKDTLTLAGRSAPTRFVYDLRLSSGLRPSRRGDGGIDLLDARGRTRFVLLAPFMVDAAHRAGDVGRVSMTLRRSGSGWRVVLVADRRWLAARDRRWPVRVDPTVSVGPAPDCRLEQSSPTSSFCATATDDVDGGSGVADHSILAFNVQGALPADAQVLYATVNMYLGSWSNGTTVPVGAYPLTRSFTSAATWSAYDGTHAWSAPGGDYSSTALDTRNILPSAGWSAWTVSSLARGWVDGSTANHGVILKEPADNVQNELLFNGSGASSNQPYLQLEYRPRVGEPRAATIDRQRLSDRMGLGVNVANGNLLVESDALRVHGTGLDQRVAGTYNNLYGAWVNSGTGWRTGPAPDEFMKVEANGSVVYYGPDGQAFPFDANPGGGYTVPPGIDATVLHNGDGSYTFTFRDGQKHSFDSNGRLVSLVDQNANTIRYTYNAANGNVYASALTSILDTQGRSSSVTMGASPEPDVNFLTRVQDSSGRSVSYGYTGYQLTSFTDGAGNRTSYTYDASENLTQITDPAGEVTKLAYDPSRRITQVTRVTNNQTGTGDATGYAYNPPNTPIFGTSALCSAGSYGQTVKNRPEQPCNHLLL